MYIKRIFLKNIRCFNGNGNGVRLRYFLIFLAALDQILFQQLYDKVPRDVNSWFPRHNGRIPRKGRRSIPKYLSLTPF